MSGKQWTNTEDDFMRKHYTSEDATAKAFTKTVTNNANFQNKELYLLCNSGARGARAAAVLLRRCLFDCGRAGSWIKNNVYFACIFLYDRLQRESRNSSVQEASMAERALAKTEAADRIENGV